MSEWIPIQPDDYNLDEREQAPGGVEFIVGLSPFDIPDGVRGFYDKKLDRYVIEFRYLGSEERRVQQKANENVELLIGQNSNRLYAIHVNAKAMQASSVRLSCVAPMIANYGEHLTGRERKLYKIAERIVTDEAGRLPQLLQTN